MDDPATPSDRDIFTRRVIPFSRALVWRAWTGAEHLANWWGPEGFSNTFHEFDPRPGGAWRLTMHGPDGKDYPNEMRFVEVAHPERIMIDHLSQPQFRITATFTEVPNGTEITFRQTFATAKLRDQIATYAADANEQNLDRLERELAGMAHPPKQQKDVCMGRQVAPESKSGHCPAPTPCWLPLISGWLRCAEQPAIRKQFESDPVFPLFFLGPCFSSE